MTCLTLGFVLASQDAGASGVDQATRKLYKRPSGIPFPKDNAHSSARESLGKTLFFDPRLSGSNWLSCATCHNPGLDWTDGLPRALGVGMKPLPRRTPTLLNLAWSELMLWDGRSHSLESQSLEPLASESEMNMPPENLVAKLRKIPGYGALFEAAYPEEGLSIATVTKALATFERTIVSGTAPFDRWIQGEEKALTPAAVRGFALFNGKALCSRCHSGWRLTDDSFHDIGLPDADLGRGAILPDVEILQHAFKTPTLRNVDRRAPYMHDGSIATLVDVIEFYDQGGKARRLSQAEDVRPLGLTSQEKADLLSFLKTLTSADKSVVLPILPR
ncbi:cytochrome-c peroxidase [Oligoflexus tunisiensis]|uniref:cytochrome-c peroxidase n=1 Tax=Oligoflexus tunisiensis TaxID=708132 RepID=UPI001C4085F9|nr:cytochrome c peroxidase [Oligoflexus tunisiensis]